MMNMGRLRRSAVALMIAFSMMVSGAMGSAQGIAPFDALNGVMSGMEDAHSMTIDAQFALRQNGEDVVTGETMYQYDSDNRYARATFTHIGDEARDIEMSVNNAVRVVRIGEDYYLMPLTADREMSADKSAVDTVKAANADHPPAKTTQDYLTVVLNQLFGAVSDKVVVSDTGLSLNLAGDDVPAILNLVASMLGNHSVTGKPMNAAQSNEPTISYGRKNGQKGDAPAQDKHTSLSLGRYLHIDSIDMNLALEGGIIRGIQFNITLIGNDAQDTAVNTQLAAVIRFTDINATIPGTIDMTDVEMTPIKRSAYR